MDAKLKLIDEKPITANKVLGEFSIDSITKGNIKIIEINNGNGEPARYPITRDLLKSIDDCINVAKTYAPYLICGHLMDRNTKYSLGDDTIQLNLLTWEGKREGYFLDTKTKSIVDEAPVLYSGIGATLFMDDNFGRDSKICILPDGSIYEEKGRDSILKKDPAEEI